MNLLSIEGETEYFNKVLKTCNCADFKILNDVLILPVEDRNLFEKIKDITAKIIFEKYSESIILEILNKQYSFTKGEQNEIKNALFLNLKEKAEKIIKEEIDAFLNESEKLSIEGFVKFRLRDFKKYIKKEIDSFVEKKNTDEEYSRFIDLLSTYVDMQPPLINILHINVTRHNGYLLYDGKLNEITGECVRQVLPFFEDEEIGFEDMLLSILINISPRIIYFHNHTNLITPVFIETIKNIFRKRLVLCDGCSFCKTNM